MINFKDIKLAIKSLIQLPQWWMQKLHKRDLNLWTFDAWSGLRYSDNPRALYEYVLNNEPSIRTVWMTDRMDIYLRLKKEGKPVALRKSKEGKAIQKKAGYFFCTHGKLVDSSEGELQYMNGIHYVNLWHGVPIKQIGDDETGFKYKHITIGKKIKTAIRKVIVPWEFLFDTMLCGSPFFEPFMRSAFGRTYQRFINIPEPRLSKLYSKQVDSFIVQINQKFDNPIKVMYMPTFRDSNFGQFNPFSHADFDVTKFTEILDNNNMVFMYKGHFLDRNMQNQIENKRILSIDDSCYEDLYLFLKDIDILITDYSSVYFDFLYLKKPIILFPFDYNEYIKLSRPFYFNYELMEAKRVYNWNELGDCLQKKTYYVPSNDEITRFRPISAQDACEHLVQILKS